MEATLGAEKVFPTGDGKPMAETKTHVDCIIRTIALLREHFRPRKGALVTGNIFLYVNGDDPTDRRSPDVMVAFNVPEAYREESFFVSRGGGPPRVVIEFASEATWAEDVGPKFTFYERIGVEEYFLYDPFGHWLERPLLGYRLIRTAESLDDLDAVPEQSYEALRPSPDGSLPSRELALRLVPAGADLDFYDLQGNRITPPEGFKEEARKAAAAAKAALDLATKAEDRARKAETDARREAGAKREAEADARAARDEVRKQADRADKAEADKAALLAEIALLRASQPKGGPPPA